MFAPNTLAGRVAFVTGGATGLGLEIATQYATLGASVMIASRKEENLRKAVEEIGRITDRIDCTVLDVRDPAAVKSAIDRTVERFGALDILVNGAAGNFVCPTAGLTPNGWKTVIDIDLNGTFYCCHAAYAHLKASSFGGRIISIVTMLGVTGWPGAAHASAAKAGIIALSRTLAIEWGDDRIRVNTISPGPIGDTEGVRKMYEETGRGELEQRRTALGRFGKRQDIAHAATYLASDLADYVTGDNLVVDGGRWLKYVAA
ncbi:MAG: SDR family oxidoreductase [Burkholderiaceae bacterium]